MSQKLPNVAVPIHSIYILKATADLKVTHVAARCEGLKVTDRH